MPPKKAQQKKKEIKKEVKKVIKAPRTQRKIPHLLSSQGNGDTFRYLKLFNPKAGFAPGNSVYLTEKWDGTTVQATKDGIYKRIDKIQAGDPKKHSASEEERYGLIKLDLDNNQNQYINRSCSQYLEIFENLEEGLCVYFEAVGTSIGARFQASPDWYDIRVFDFSKDGEFLSFDEAIILAEELGLPLVHYTEVNNLDVEYLIKLLSKNPSYYDNPAECEGFVIRDSENKIAKFRVADLSNIIEPEADLN